MISSDCTKLYIVMNNTDRTEGRGREYVFAVTELKTTAKRIAKGAYVQGMDCPIFVEDIVTFDGVKYLPISRVAMVVATREDIEKEKEETERCKRELLRQEITRKALALGLSEEDIRTLQDTT